MLGIRTALKPDLECSAAELVYGTSLRIPDDFFGYSQGSADLDPGDYVQRLRHAMTHLRATPPRASTNIFVAGRVLLLCRVGIGDKGRVRIRSTGFQVPGRVITNWRRSFSTTIADEYADLKQILQQQLKLMEALVVKLSNSSMGQSSAAGSSHSLDQMANSLTEFLYAPQTHITFDSWYKR
nr:unnamed protein product [Spirometra erinaceieuropaei]